MFREIKAFAALASSDANSDWVCGQPLRRKLSAVRRERAMIVRAGFAGTADGKIELSHIQRFGTSKHLPCASTTFSFGSLPMRHVPIVCADRWKVQMSVALAAFQTWVISSSA